MICPVCRRDVVDMVPAVKVRTSFRQGKIARELVFGWHLAAMGTEKCRASYLTVTKARAEAKCRA